MDRVIYLAMSGAKAALQHQDIVAHNLANVSTTGFRAELAALRAVPVQGDGATTRVWALDTTPGHDATPGPITDTGHALDVAMLGNAWLAVQAADGTEAYTRAGALEVDAAGTLVQRGSGRAVLGDGGPIAVPPGALVAVASDGSVSAKLGNAPAQPLGRLKLVTPAAPLQRGDDGLFRGTAGELAADDAARLREGALEGSNVNPIESMVAMISAARLYEQQMAMLKTAQEREQAAGRLLGQSGG